jgi:hypothetical protein
VVEHREHRTHPAVDLARPPLIGHVGLWRLMADFTLLVFVKFVLLVVLLCWWATQIAAWVGDGLALVLDLIMLLLLAK